MIRMKITGESLTFEECILATNYSGCPELLQYVLRLFDSSFGDEGQNGYRGWNNDEGKRSEQSNELTRTWRNLSLFTHIGTCGGATSTSGQQLGSTFDQILRL